MLSPADPSRLVAKPRGARGGAELGTVMVACLIVLFGAAALAPPLYALGQWSIRINLVPQLRPFAFERYFNRALLISALLMLWPLSRLLKLRHRSDVFLAYADARARHFLAGLGLGAGGLLVVTAALLGCQVFFFRQAPQLREIMLAALTAGLVAPAEEIIFRGALLGALQRQMGWGGGSVATAILFAVVHFLRPDPAVQAIAQVTAGSGVRLLPHLLWQFGRPELMFGVFLTLILMGLVLGYAVMRTQSLVLAIGLHAGWVFGLKLTSLCCGRTAQSVWVGDDLRTGLAPLLLMLSTAPIIHAITADAALARRQA